MSALVAIIAGLGLVLGNAQGARARIALHILAVICGVIVIVIGVVGLVLVGSVSYA